MVPSVMAVSLASSNTLLTISLLIGSPPSSNISTLFSGGYVRQEDLTRCAPSCCDRAVNGASVPITVGRLAGKKQRVLDRRRKRPHGLHATHRHIAVGAPGKRVGMPIVGMDANQRPLDPAPWQTQHIRQCVKHLIDNDLLRLVDQAGGRRPAGPTSELGCNGRVG